MWTGAAALLARRGSLSSSTRHLLWKMALFGPLATLLLAAAMSWGFERAPGDNGISWRDRCPVARGRSRAGGPRCRAGERRFDQESADAASPARRAGKPRGWSLLAACTAGAAALGLLRFATSALLLWRGLRGRREVQDARLLQRLERLRARTGLRRVALTESAGIGSPLVIGASEICVPLARLAALTDAEVDAVFAHELAHLERRDGLWFPAAGLVQSVLWANPLVHWASSRFRQTAELACDDRAVELTGIPSVWRARWSRSRRARRSPRGARWSRPWRARRARSSRASGAFSMRGAGREPRRALGAGGGPSPASPRPAWRLRA